MTRPSGPTIMFVVSSLMGAGHLQRTLLIAKAVKAAGGHAIIVNGGRVPAHMDVGGIELMQLPPVWVEGVDYSQLFGPDGLADAAYMRKRAADLCAIFRQVRPDVLVTELFPFGRRSLSAEFCALLDQAKGQARVFCSVRDVLEPKKKPKRLSETADRLRAWFDGVLVHGDERLIALDATWPPATGFAGFLRYTGYVCHPPVAPCETQEILVAVGGGAIGRSLLRTAVDAARLDRRTWRIRVGGRDAAETAAGLRKAAGAAPVVIEAAASDYRARLAGCACSVSLFGYNTATDLLVAGCPAVISPMNEGGEREQNIRAEAFGGVGGFVHVHEPTAASLLAAVEAAMSARPATSHGVDTEGARRSARILIEAAEQV